MLSRQPTARAYHAAVGVGAKLFVWGGYSDRNFQTTTLESFDVPSLSWDQPQQLGGSLPDGLHNAAVTGDGENCCSLGGNTPCGLINTLYDVNLSTALCAKLIPNSPPDSLQKQQGSRSVYFRSKLVVYGGRTDQAVTDCLHVFDFERRVWGVQPTTGEKPPPLQNHTFTKIDCHRAVVFGGNTGNGRTNNTYVLDMETWHWTKLEITGDRPPARSRHDTCCITGPLTGQHHPLLMLVGGWGDRLKVLGDVWLLDVDKGVWFEITLPEDITPRYGHSATVFGGGPSFRVAVLFGGRTSSYFVISETTLLLLELKGGSWQVTRVVQPDELGSPDEMLREQMNKLEIPPQEISEQLTRRLTEMDWRLRDEVRRSREMERQFREQLREMEVQLRETEGQLREMEGRWREAQHIADALQHQLEQKEDPFWMVERSEIHLTEQELGRGGWATVRVAEFRGLQVAAKCLHSIIISDYNRQLFVREMSIAAKLRHPNLIQFIGATLEGELVILTELMTTSLRAILERGPLNPAQISSISRDIARALSYLHHTKPDPIVHRDVSSANVLLNQGPNNTWLAKLSDYGSANFVQRVTTAGPGNPSYAAPEAFNPSLQSPKMDVYSYGVLLVEMATRRFPDKLTLVLQIQRIQVPGLPGIIQRCIQDDPARRPNISDLLPLL